MLRPPHAECAPLATSNAFEVGRGINESHWNEWVNDSAVDPDLTALNIISLEDYEPHERLLYDLPDRDRRNDGRVRDWVLRRYAHIEHGGWWCSGVDVLTGEDSQWGCFKPDEAKQEIEYNRQGHFKKAKSIKYEHPPKTNTEIFALFVPLHIWKAISERSASRCASRYDAPLPENITVTPEGAECTPACDSDLKSESVRGRAIGFWAWVLDNPSIPIIICEGAKKAGSLLSAGYAAIALPGIFNGYRQKKDELGNKIDFPSLIPQLKAFAQEGREISFCFDNDSNPKTIQNVRGAIARTGGLLVKEGCKVSVITWDYPQKGVDDLIVARGRDCFDKLYKTRIPLAKFKLASLLDISKYNPLTINVPFLESDNLTPPTDAQIVGLRSPKGSNKTGWMSKTIEKCIQIGKPVLIITHRIQLAKALCARFGIDHIEEVRSSGTKGVLGYGLCIDSLHSNSQAKFNPEDWEGATVILDECEQVIWHLLDSSTCQSNRVAIIETFQRLLKIVVGTGGKIYLADADLSAIAINYIQKLIGISVKTWVVDNVYQRTQKRKLIVYSGNDPSELLSEVVAAIKRGEKPLIHTTGQKAKSRYGSINLESHLKKLFPQLKILRIDRESVAEPNHPAYGCMGNLNQILGSYDIAIASPVIETGVSIDIKEHFDSVWCIAYGVQTVDAVCQTVERLRDDVPRHIWIKKTAKNSRIGNGSTSIKALLRSQHKLTQANISLLNQAGFSDDFDDLEANFSPESLTVWGERACLVNSGKNEYRNEVTLKLLAEGYELYSPRQQDLLETESLKDGLKETCEKNYRNYREKISLAVTPSDAELEELGNKRSKTEPERLKERKGSLNKLYGVDVTPLLVEKDDKGWYPQLQLHYYLTVGATYLAERDRRSLSTMKEQGNGKAFKPDINKRQLSAKIKALELIEIEQFLNPDAEFTKDTLDDWRQKVIHHRFDLLTLLGVSINPEKDSAIAVAQRILKKLGLKLEFLHQVRIEGKPTRVYKGCNPDPDGRSLIFQNWLAREGVTPFCKEELYTKEGVTAA